MPRSDSQDFVNLPSRLDQPVTCASLEIIYLVHQRKHPSLVTSTHLGEAAVVEEILHDQDVHPHRSAGHSVAIADLEEAIYFGQYAWALTTLAESRSRGTRLTCPWKAFLVYSK